MRSTRDKKARINLLIDLAICGKSTLNNQINIYFSFKRKREKKAVVAKRIL